MEVEKDWVGEQIEALEKRDQNITNKTEVARTLEISHTQRLHHFISSNCHFYLSSKLQIMLLSVYLFIVTILFKFAFQNYYFTIETHKKKAV